MRKLFTLYILLAWLSAVGQSPNVLYGERNLSDTRLAVYFDRDGSIYPEYLIKNDMLGAAGSSIKRFYQDNPDEFAAIAMLYQCAGTVFSEANVKALNDAILKKIQEKIDKDTRSSKSVTFLVHGFRKPFLPTGNDESTSEQDFTAMKDNIDGTAPGICTVEIYWDALYGCCFSAKPWQNKPLFQLFQQAQSYNAIQVGKAFKQLLSGQRAAQVNVISHSLGAKVAAYALFDEDSDGTPTPSNAKVNIYFIAPAIGASTLTDNYHKRNSSVDFRTKDNYSLKVVYNDDDFALRKKDPKIGVFGPGPENYGLTTLGCNHKGEAILLAEKLKSTLPNSPVTVYDHSFVGICHLVVCYFRNNQLQEVFADLK